MPEIRLITLQGLQNLPRNPIQTSAGVAKPPPQSDSQLCRGCKIIPEIRFRTLQGMQNHP